MALAYVSTGLAFEQRQNPAPEIDPLDRRDGQKRLITPSHTLAEV